MPGVPPFEPWLAKLPWVQLVDGPLVFLDGDRALDELAPESLERRFALRWLATTQHLDAFPSGSGRGGGRWKWGFDAHPVRLRLNLSGMWRFFTTDSMTLSTASAMQTAKSTCATAEHNPE